MEAQKSLKTSDAPFLFFSFLFFSFLSFPFLSTPPFIAFSINMVYLPL